MEFRILGPLEAWHEGREVSLGGPKPRALLAVLLLHANEVVSRDQLLDELWGEDSATVAAGALRVNVSRLRKALLPDMLTTRSPGYVLQIEPGALDLHRFEHLVEEGRSLLGRGLAADASERLREALSLWRGPAFMDFAYERFAQTAIARLDEIRLAALELRIDADLALGRHHELVAELEALVTEHPLRERLRGMPDDWRSTGRAGRRRLSTPIARHGARSSTGWESSQSTSSRSSNGRSSSTTRRSTQERPHAPLSRKRRSGRSSSRPPTKSGSALSSQWPSSSCVIPRACSSLRGWCRAQPTSRPHPPGSTSAVQSSTREASRHGRLRSRRSCRGKSWRGSPVSSTSSCCLRTRPTGSSPRGLPTSN